jgi:hypothetical protein
MENTGEIGFSWTKVLPFISFTGKCVRNKTHTDHKTPLC